MQLLQSIKGENVDILKFNQRMKTIFVLNSQVFIQKFRKRKSNFIGNKGAISAT